MFSRAFRLTLTAVLATIGFAACGGGGSNPGGPVAVVTSSPAPNPTNAPTATPAPVPTATPTAAGTVTSNSFANEPVSSTGSQTVTLVPNGAFSGTLTLPAATAAGGCGTSAPTVSGGYGTTPPAGSPAFTGSNGTLFYVSFEVSCSVTITQTGSATLTFPSGSVSADYAVGSGSYQPLPLNITPTGQNAAGDTIVSITAPSSVIGQTIPGGTLFTVVFFPTSAQ
jgi:hypothetical protein